MTSTPVPLVVEPSTTQPDFAGVYVAKASQLLIGPLTHLEHFATAAAGTTFGGGSDASAAQTSVTLPQPSLRYVVDCAAHTSDLPNLPSYATVPSRRAPRRLGTVSPPPPPPEALASSAEKETGAAGRKPNGSLQRVDDQLTTDAPTAAAISRSDTVRRMNESAAACLARLKQRCVDNGMPTAVFNSIHLPRAADATANAFSGVVGAAPQTLSASLQEEPPKIAQLPKADAERVAKACLNDRLAALVEEKLGTDHVRRCCIPHTSDSLSSQLVQDTVRWMARVLKTTRGAQIYVYSLDGKGTASVLATLYLMQEEHLGLSDVLNGRLLACTPRMSCLQQLLERDPHPETFDKAAYLHQYLARRYPAAAPATIEAAVATSKGNYMKAERLVRVDVSFQAPEHAVFLPNTNYTSNGYLSSTRRFDSTAVSNGLSVSNFRGGAVRDGPSSDSPASQLYTLRGAHYEGSGGRVPPPQQTQSSNLEASLSSLSLCSSFVKEPVQLTPGDETIIASLYKALADANVGVSCDEVRESYVSNRRAQDLVLRQFLLKRRPSLAGNDASVPRGNSIRNASFGTSGRATPNGPHPPSARAVSAEATTQRSGSTPPMAEVIALPQFKPHSASRRGSAATISKKPPPLSSALSSSARRNDGGVSPEPSRPSLCSTGNGSTPTKTRTAVAQPASAAVKRNAANKGKNTSSASTLTATLTIAARQAKSLSHPTAKAAATTASSTSTSAAPPAKAQRATAAVTSKKTSKPAKKRAEMSA